MAISIPLSSRSSSSEDRPHLPPLHTLDLPTLNTESPMRLPGIHHFRSLHENERLSRTIPLHAPHATVPIPRHFSFSSSTSSRTPSPSPSDSSSVSTTTTSTTNTTTSSMFPFPFPPSSSSSQSKMRLIPSSLEDADAVVVVPPRSASCGGENDQKPLLLVGPALKHLRHPQRQIAKGARIHPYRIARASNQSHHHHHHHKQ